jgi:hypothetical protein
VKYCFAFVLVVSAMVMAAGCGKTQERGARIDEAFRAAVSPDVQTLVSIQLEKLKASELYRRHEKELQLPQFNAMAERVGLDPRRDVSKLLVVWNTKHLLLLALGGFSTRQLEEKLTSGGARRVPYKSFTLFTRGNDSVAFPETGLAIVGSTAVAQSALDLRSARGGKIPPDLEARVAEIPANAQIWEVSRGGLPAANFPLRSDLASALSNITSFVDSTSFGVNFDSGSHLQARIICKSPEGAQRVHDAMRGLIGLARLATHDNELDLLRMWDAISISKEQQVIRVQADLSSDLTDKLIDQAASLRGHGLLN